MNADLIVTHGNIVTMDPLTPRCEAMAIKDGYVLAVGSNEKMLTFCGSDTEVLNVKGRTVLPGLHDTHLHLLNSGYFNGTMADLVGAATLEDLQSRLRIHSDRVKDGWLFGVGWYTGVFSEDNLGRYELDVASGQRPCMIYSSDLHSACLNTAACEAIGLNSETPDPPNGRFARKADGSPTGMLHEEAIRWANGRLPEVNDDQYIYGVCFGQEHANRHGLTGVFDAAVTDLQCRIFQRMASDQQLTVRISGCAKVDPSETVASAVERLSRMRREHRGEMFRVHSAKFFLDGVLENRTAAMIDGYADAAGGNAPLMFTPSQINEMFAAFDAERFQIHVHVIGDLAVRSALDGLQYALEQNGRWPSHHHLTHLQIVRPEDIPRLAQLGAVANIQTLWARHAPSTTDVAVPIAGPALAGMIYPFKSIIDHGALWVLTSDWGVSTLNPFEIMETAITRQPPGKRERPVFLPEQRLSRHQALKGYTTNAALASWQTHTGRLASTSVADFIVLDQDILTCDVYAIGKTNVLSTFVAGRLVFTL